MSKHTPGPWSFREYSLANEMLAKARSFGIEPIRFINNDGSVPITAGDTRICTIDCQASFRRGTGHKTECSERDANARLISIAPEMYDYISMLAAEGDSRARQIIKLVVST